ncbi:uncharacterized protein LOC106642580 [Copidosoma floridanum]|uniref:uncharacterized protein LOC106642580 n=1 Tax=Copidosoma floridanum TaxID=29053 RepID=UPI0006C998DE|nr:uncharacterized protein LOC106642580 [Copidosoma floridanum]
MRQVELQFCCLPVCFLLLVSIPATHSTDACQHPQPIPHFRSLLRPDYSHLIDLLHFTHSKAPNCPSVFAIPAVTQTSKLSTTERFIIGPFDNMSANPLPYKFKKLSGRIDKLEASSAEAHGVAMQTQGELNILMKCATLTDTCEICISGILKCFSENWAGSIHTVLELTDNLQALNHICSQSIDTSCVGGVDLAPKEHLLVDSEPQMDPVNAMTGVVKSEPSGSIAYNAGPQYDIVIGADGLSLRWNLQSPAEHMAMLFKAITKSSAETNGDVLTDFFTVLQDTATRFSDIVVAGDLNSDLLRHEYYSSHLHNLIAENSLYLVPFGATHHCDATHTWLDVILTGTRDRVLSSRLSDVPFINSHDYQIVDYNISFIRRDVPCMTRDFRFFSASDFNGDVAIGQWVRAERLHDSGMVDDVNSCLDNFYVTVTDALDLHAPMRLRVSSHRPPAPWFDALLKDRCKQRDRLYGVARRTGDLALLAEYRRLRAVLKKYISAARDRFLAKALEDERNPARCWQIMRRHGLLQQTQGSPLQSLSADTVARYFSSTSCAHPPYSVQKLREVLLQPSNVVSEFSLAPISRVEVGQAIMQCCGKTKGHSFDGLSFACFRESLFFLNSFLTHLFNMSFATCTYPSSWKKSVIVPLSKVPHPIDPSDTHPIANLTHLARVLDVLVARRVYDYLEENSLLSPMQSGFQAGFSTQTALLKITEDIRLGMEHGMVTILVLFDFRKAFDSIGHELLLREMGGMGFSADTLKWFFCYLSDCLKECSQVVVKPDGRHTSFMLATSGVPQSTTLGPVLFLIFINSILSVLHHSVGVLFADDLQITIQCKPSDLHKTIGVLNDDIESIVFWSSAHGLALHHGKILVTLIGTCQQSMRVDEVLLPPILVSGSVIPLCSKIKDLGVLISNDLPWNAHVSAICFRVHGTLYRLRYKGRSFLCRIKLTLTTTLIRPRFDYACLVYMSLSGYLAIKLDRQCNTVLRYIFNLRRDTAMLPYYARLGWLRSSKRRDYFLSVAIYKVLTTQRPEYLYNLFPRISDGILENYSSLYSLKGKYRDG